MIFIAPAINSRAGPPRDDSGLTSEPCDNADPLSGDCSIGACGYLAEFLRSFSPLGISLVQNVKCHLTGPANLCDDENALVLKEQAIYGFLLARVPRFLRPVDATEYVMTKMKIMPSTASKSFVVENASGVPADVCLPPIP